MKKAFAILTACLLLVPLTGTSLKPRVPSISGDPLDAFFSRTLSSGRSLYLAGNYPAAEKLCRQVLGAARAIGNNLNAARANYALGAVYLKLHRFRNSLECLLQGERYARLAHNDAAQIAIKTNLASLYGEIGAVDKAAQWAGEALWEARGSDVGPNLPKIQLEFAVLRAQQKSGLPEALRFFSAGIQSACGSGDWNTCATGWNHLGDAYIRRLDLFGENHLADAEAPLQRALQIRIDKHLAPEVAYRSLGRLRLEQNRFSEARDYLDQAIVLSLRPNSTLPSWNAYEYRGSVLMKQG